MGDEAGNNHTGGVTAGKAALLARSSIWKSAIVIAPLAATALFLASGTQAQTSGSTAPPNPPAASTTVMPKPAPVAARSKGPKLRDKVDRVTGPSPTTDPATPTQTTAPVAPIDAPDAARKEGPKGAGSSDAQGRTDAPAPASTPSDERRREGPKGAGESGRTEATPAPQTQPAGQRKEGPKGAEGSGRTSATPAPDTQPAERRKGPKGDVGSDHQGRTNATPLIIGALSAATSLALVVSGGNDRRASP
jgi:hypothetical protein